MIAALIYALTKDLWEQVLNKVVSTCIETDVINTSAKIKYTCEYIHSEINIEL